MFDPPCMLTVVLRWMCGGRPYRCFGTGGLARAHRMHTRQERVHVFQMAKPCWEFQNPPKPRRKTPCTAYCASVSCVFMGRALLHMRFHEKGTAATRVPEGFWIWEPGFGALISELNRTSELVGLSRGYWFAAAVGWHCCLVLCGSDGFGAGAPCVAPHSWIRCGLVLAHL